MLSLVHEKVAPAGVELKSVGLMELPGQPETDVNGSTEGISLIVITKGSSSEQAPFTS